MWWANWPGFHSFSAFPRSGKDWGAFITKVRKTIPGVKQISILAKVQGYGHLTPLVINPKIISPLWI